MKREPTTREIDQMSERELLDQARARMLAQPGSDAPAAVRRAKLLVADLRARGARVG